MNLEGKLFFALKSERILDFVLKNEYSYIQKGGVPGMSGCLEHTAVLSQLIREAKRDKKNLVVTWLDIANAYGSIPHETIFKALREAHVSEDVVNLVQNYYQIYHKKLYHRLAESGKRHNNWMHTQCCFVFTGYDVCGAVSEERDKRTKTLLGTLPSKQSTLYG